MQNNSQTYERQILPGTKTGSTCSQEVFPASRFRQPESAKEPKTTATCGPKCSELFGLFDPVGSWARTFTELLVGRTGWYSNRCVLTWKRKVTKSNRMYFQLAVSALHTKDTGLGLLHTPRATEIVEDPQKFVKRMGDRSANCYPNLASQVIYGGLLPTPTAIDAGSGRINKSLSSGSTPRPTIALAAKMNLLPTPKVQDCRHAKIDRGKSNLGEDISELAYRQTGKTSQLNPLFVEEMMGFPTGWILTPFLKESQYPGGPKPTTGGGIRPSKPTETP